MSPSQPGEELAVYAGALPRDGLPHQLLAPPDGRQLLQGWREGQERRAERKRGGWAGLDSANILKVGEGLLSADSFLIRQLGTHSGAPLGEEVPSRRQVARR